MRIHMTPQEELGFVYLFNPRANTSTPPVHPADPNEYPNHPEPSRGPQWRQTPLRDPFADLHDLLICNRR
ncbi:MAG TPA: hypothetical protein VFV50_11405 [Bdellovibrionales bacterium]|nr:hypothetical protein [Bdellovibrionales bacterium]